MRRLRLPEPSVWRPHRSKQKSEPLPQLSLRPEWWNFLSVTDCSEDVQKMGCLYKLNNFWRRASITRPPIACIKTASPGTARQSLGWAAELWLDSIALV